MPEELLKDAQRFADEVERALPPAGKILLYNEVSPGFSDRIMRMAEESIIERRRLEQDAIRAKASTRIAATLSTFGLALLALLAGVYCSLHGAQVAGGLIGSSGTLTMVAAGVLNLPHRGRHRRGDPKANQTGSAV